MPRHGTSSDELNTLEDEIAVMLTARDHLDRLADLIDLLHTRGHITPAYRADARDSLDAIAHALLVGKHNTVRLRRAERA